MNATDVPPNAIVGFSVSIIVATSLFLFQIPIAKRIARVRNDETSTADARRILYGICITVAGLCLAEITKAAFFGLFCFNNGSVLYARM
jgi:hypothetical protein